MKYKTEFIQKLKIEFKDIVKFMVKTGMDKLAENVLEKGLEPYRKEIEEMKQDQRAFFFYYLIHISIANKKYKFAAELHRNFVREAIKMNTIKLLRPFILASAKSNIGSYSYATEMTIEELKKQIDKCENEKFKQELKDLYDKLVEMYNVNKKGLYSNYMIYQTEEELKETIDYFLDKIIFLLKFCVCCMLVWLFLNLIRYY